MSAVCAPCLSCTQAHSATSAVLEATLREQSEALAGLAAAVSQLPTKGRLLEVCAWLVVCLRSFVGVFSSSRGIGFDTG